MPAQYPISYLGKTYNTSIHQDLTDGEYQSIVDGIRAKPPESKVMEQLGAIANGGSKMNLVYSYFFKDIAYKTRLCYNRWSIDEALQHKPLIEFFAGKVAENKLMYPDTLPLWEKIETGFRMCGFGTCSKPSNFPIKTIDSLLGMYCPLYGNYLDFSCGWGVRLLAALRNRANYYGIDPNDELVPRLRQMAAMYNDVNLGDTETDIRCQGSETLVEEWVGKMDFAFTSPPYFNLEDYRIGEKQSYKDGVTTYESWVKDYVRPTIENCFKYLKPGGVFGYNIKNNFNYIKHDMEKDWLDISQETGFVLTGTMTLENITRVSGHARAGSANSMMKHDNDEPIMIFKKSC